MRQAALVLLFSAALAGAPAPPDETPPPSESATKADEAGAERIFSEWHALYVNGKKVGYHTMSVQRLAATRGCRRGRQKRAERVQPVA